MTHDIVFDNNGRKFKLQLLESVKIEKSVENLADVAQIVLPEAVLNSVLNLKDRIGRGTSVTIDLGYDVNNVREFTGFIREIETNDSSMTIQCEDALFLFRKEVPNKVLQTTSTTSIAQYIIDNIDSSFTLVCDYDITFEKFTINNATGFDVLKAIQDQTKANIYFLTDKKELHIHFPFKERGGRVIYSYQRNIEESSLIFESAQDKKFEVIVESVNKAGEVRRITKGTTGGERITIKADDISLADMEKLAEAELVRRNADGFKGEFQGWLLPYCEPTYTAEIRDNDYPDKEGQYYVKSTVVEFSDAGGVRTVELGIKL